MITEATYDFEIPESIFTVRIWMKLGSLKEVVDGDIINRVFGFLASKGAVATTREEMIEFIMSLKDVEAAQVMSKHGMYKVGKYVRRQPKKWYNIFSSN